MLKTIKPHSLIVNATGLGKDRPGSPLTNECEFPEESLIWEINYRGDLLFMHQALAQKVKKRLHVEDGWIYFIHSWTQVIAEVFKVDVNSRIDEISAASTTLVKALSGFCPVVTPVNYPNHGAIKDLPDEGVVETNCLIDKNGVHPLTYGYLPSQIKGLVCQIKAYETLTVEASFEQSKDKAVLALLNHPLIHGYDNAVKLVDEMSEHYGQYTGTLK